MKKLFFLFIILVFVSGCDISSGNRVTPSDLSSGDTFDDSSLNLSSGLTVNSVDGDMSSLYTSLNQQELTAFTDCLSACAQSTEPDLNCFMNCLSTSDLFPDGGAFNLSLNITNSTSDNIVIIIEAGTRFVPGDDSLQPMLVIVDVTITVTPGTNRYRLPVFCLNSGASAPSSIDDAYTRAEEVALGCLAQIVDITETKDILGLEYANISRIQEIIWKCVNGETITSDDWNFLNGLPPAQ